MDEAILISYLKGKASQEECAQVEAWSEASAANRKTLEDLYYILFLSDRQAAMNAVDVEKSLIAFKRNLKGKELKPKFLSGWKRYVANVAAFLIGAVFAVGIFAWYSQKHADSYIVSTEPGQRAQVLLPDGSKLWLNASSSVEYATSFFSSERRVFLSGEAYFEVKKNPRLPFIVSSHGIETRVTGTKFNIRAYKKDNQLKTTLLEGSVEVSLPNNQEEEIHMIPNEQLTVDLNNFKTSLVHTSVADESIRWIGGVLHFNQSTLQEIAEVLEKHYNVHIKIDDIALQQQRFSCDFDLSDDIYQILSVLSFTKSFDYRIDNKQIILTAQ